MTAMKKSINPNTILLFLVVAFPIHFWSIIMQLYEIEDTPAWEALGRGGYSLLFALAESVLIFVLLLPVFILLIKRVGETKALVITSWLYLGVAAAASVAQAFATIDKSAGTLWHRLFTLVGRFEGVSFILFMLLLLATLYTPVLLSLRSYKVSLTMYKGIERIASLTFFYLFLDAIGIMVIVIRNITG